MPPCLRQQMHSLKQQIAPCNPIYQAPAGPLFSRWNETWSLGVSYSKRPGELFGGYRKESKITHKARCRGALIDDLHEKFRHEKIGIWDSGIGGLSVAAAVQDVLPGIKIHYIADTAYFPYGGQRESILVQRALYLSQSLVSEGCCLVVVACNTASSAALESIRASLQVPCVGIEPAVKPAVQISRAKHVVVLATQRTADGPRLAALIREHAHGARVTVLPMPGLADMVEAGKITGPVVSSMLWSQLEGPISEGADTVVLGCTHYAFLQELLAEILPKYVTVLDAARPVANRVKYLLQNVVEPCTSYVHSPTADTLTATDVYVDLKVTGDQVQVESVIDQLSSKRAKLPRCIRLRTCVSKT